jgi:hypothetical protein
LVGLVFPQRIRAASAASVKAVDIRRLDEYARGFGDILASAARLCHAINKHREVKNTHPTSSGA